MTENNTTYLLDLGGVKTLYDEIMKDVNGKTLNVSSLDEIQNLTADDLDGVETIIMPF